VGRTLLSDAFDFDFDFDFDFQRCTQWLAGHSSIPAFALQLFDKMRGQNAASCPRIPSPSKTAASIEPTLWWMEGGSPHSFQFPTLNLQPYRTQNFDVLAMLSTAGLRNFNGSVNLVFDAQGIHVNSVVYKCTSIAIDGQ
jgi:hypothetical protein